MIFHFIINLRQRDYALFITAFLSKIKMVSEYLIRAWTWVGDLVRNVLENDVL